MTLYTIRQGTYLLEFSLARTYALNKSRYSDDQYEYRHVQLPKDMLKKIPADYFDSAKGTLKLLWEQEWRSLGITQVSSERGFVGDDDRDDVLFHLSTVFIVSMPLNHWLITTGRAWDGNIMRCMNRSHTFFCSSKNILSKSLTAWFSLLINACRRPLNYQPPVSQ